MKILLLSDATMNVNAGGMSQTLYNLFSFCKPEDILCIAPQKVINANPPSAPFNNRYIGYKFDVISSPPNRITKKILPIINWLNFSINQKKPFKKLQKHIAIFNADVAISCPNGAIGILMHNKLLNGFLNPIFPYFMDDWMYKQNFKWLGNNLQISIKAILKKNKSWLIISNELRNILMDRYQLTPERVLQVRNPVVLNNVLIIDPMKEKQTYTLAYAGSLWDMHYDSFLVVAKAIQKISSSKSINLILYTGEHFWKLRQFEIEPLGVIYGGSIPYNQVHQVLHKADALLLSSSFSIDLYTHSKASIQTKITDYLKAQRLIISCGPEYSANHTFLKSNNCGICIESNDVDTVVNSLEAIIKDIPNYQYMIENGLNVLKAEFSFEVVHEKVRLFLHSK